jgi:hypothetical protein
MPLFRSMPPLPDEWLAGLIARASATNGHGKSSDILWFANLAQNRPDYLAFTDVDVVPPLAHLLGVPAEELARYLHPRLDRQTVDFFGVPVRDLFIERRIRRVSPAGLRDLPYQRAIWQIRTFEFDPVTLDPLVTSCPECGSELGFKLTKGVEFCDRCEGDSGHGFRMPTVDLRKIEQDPVVVSDRQALDFVTGLLNPRFETFDTSVVPELVGTRARGELFEIAHVIAAALLMNERGTVDRNNWHRSEIGVIPPELLAKAGRAILDFPSGFVRLSEDAAAYASERPGEWGVLKAFGALARIPRDRYVVREFREQVAQLLKETLSTRAQVFGVVGKAALRPQKFVPLRTIKDTMLDSQSVLMRLAEHPKTLRLKSGTSAKAPVLLHKSQTQMTLVQYKDQVPAMTVALALGVPSHAVDDLAYRRLNFVYTGASTQITVADNYMSGRSMRLLESKLVEGMKPIKPDPTFCTFSQAMLMFPAGRRPWVPLIERLLDGRIEHVLHKRPGRGTLKAIAVKGVEFIRDQLTEEQAAMPRPSSTRLTAGSVNLMLGISAYEALQAIMSAHLLIPGEDGCFSYDEVLAFASTYIFANEMGARGRRPSGVVRSWMDAHEIQPAFDFPAKGGLIYYRDNVEPLLELGSAYAASKLRTVICEAPA